MRPHHETAIRRLADHFSKEEDCLAVIVGGTVAKGIASEHADIDILLVVTDESYRKHEAENSLVYFSTSFCDYPGGYVDGKIVNVGYLKAAAERGNEATRAAFTGALLAYSAIAGLEEMLAQIPVYQKHEQREKIQAFYAQFECAYWYLGEAIKRGDRYLLTHAVSSMVLYGGRLVLAHNEILYPYHKLFMAELDRAPEKPDNLTELIGALLEEPGADTAKAFYDSIKSFRQWNAAWEAWPVRFMKDTEWAWMENKAYIGDV